MFWGDYTLYCTSQQCFPVESHAKAPLRTSEDYHTGRNRASDASKLVSFLVMSLSQDGCLGVTLWTWKKRPEALYRVSSPRSSALPLGSSILRGWQCLPNLHKKPGEEIMCLVDDFIQFHV